MLLSNFILDSLVVSQAKQCMNLGFTKCTIFYSQVCRSCGMLWWIISTLKKPFCNSQVYTN